MLAKCYSAFGTSQQVTGKLNLCPDGNILHISRGSIWIKCFNPSLRYSLATVRYIDLSPVLLPENKKPPRPISQRFFLMFSLSILVWEV